MLWMDGWISYFHGESRTKKMPGLFSYRKLEIQYKKKESFIYSWNLLLPSMVEIRYNKIGAILINAQAGIQFSFTSLHHHHRQDRL